MSYDKAVMSQSTGKVDAQLKYDLTISQSNNAKTKYDTAISELDTAIDEALANKTELEEQKADYLGYLSNDIMVSPCDGIVTGINAAAGAEVNEKTNLVTVSDGAQSYFTVSISQDDISSLTLGQDAQVLLSSYPDKALHGKIDSISSAGSRLGAAVSYTVTVLLDKTDINLYAGMSGDVTFVTRQKTDVLYVSNQAIINENGKQFVKIKGEDGNPKQIEIATGFSDGSNVEVLSGLKEGDIVLIESKVRVNNK